MTISSLSNIQPLAVCWTPSPARILGSMLATVQTVSTPRMKVYSPSELVRLVAYAPRHGLYESERALCGLALEVEGGAP